MTWWVWLIFAPLLAGAALTGLVFLRYVLFEELADLVRWCFGRQPQHRADDFEW